MNTFANLAPQWEALAVEVARLCPSAPAAAICEAMELASRAGLDPDTLTAAGYGTQVRSSPLALIFRGEGGNALVQGGKVYRYTPLSGADSSSDKGGAALH